MNMQNLTPYSKAEILRLDREIGELECRIRQKEAQRREIINRSNANKQVAA